MIYYIKKKTTTKDKTLNIYLLKRKVKEENEKKRRNLKDRTLVINFNL